MGFTSLRTERYLEAREISQRKSLYENQLINSSLAMHQETHPNRSISIDCVKVNPKVIVKLKALYPSKRYRIILPTK